MGRTLTIYVGRGLPKKVYNLKSVTELSFVDNEKTNKSSVLDYIHSNVASMSAKGSNITFNIKIDEGIIFTITLTNCQKLNTISAVIRGKKLKSCTPEALLKSYGALNFNYSKDGSKIESTVWNDTISMSDAPNGTNISSGDGKDKITGSAYKDVINSGAGNDKISAGAGDDYINAGKGKDKIILNSGNNTVVFTKGDGEDTVVKGSGSDILQFKNFKNISALKKGFKLSKSGKNLVIKYTSKDKVTLKDFYKDGTSVVTLKSKDGKAIKFTDFYSSYIFNTYIGKNGKAFKKTGTDLNDLIKGANKNDSLKGGKGYDKLYGYNGKDTIYGGADNDYIDGGKHDDKLYGDAGNDTIKGGAGNDSIKGGVGNDVINAGAGKNSIYYSLGDGNDIIQYGGGEDTLIFDKGTNISAAYSGNDLKLTYSGSSKSNTITVADYNNKKSVKWINNSGTQYRFNGYTESVGSSSSKHVLTDGNNMVCLDVEEDTSYIKTSNDKNIIWSLGDAGLDYTYGGGTDIIYSLSDFTSDDTYNAAITGRTSIVINDTGGMDTVNVTGNISIVYKATKEFVEDNHYVIIDKNTLNNMSVSEFRNIFSTNKGMNIFSEDDIYSLNVNGKNIEGGIEDWTVDSNNVQAAVAGWLTDNSSYSSVGDALARCSDAELLGTLKTCFVNGTYTSPLIEPV